MTCYLPRWFTRPQTVTHPSTNRAQCRLTTLVELNSLTTTLGSPSPGRDQAVTDDVYWAPIYLEAPTDRSVLGCPDLGGGVVVQTGCNYKRVARRRVGEERLYGIYFHKLSSATTSKSQRSPASASVLSSSLSE